MTTDVGVDQDDDRRETPIETFRPSLHKLTLDLDDMRSELWSGLDDRESVIRWARRLTVRTLGELPQRFYLEIARQVRLDVGTDAEQGVLLAALLRPARRRRDLPDDVVDEIRTRLVGSLLRPATHRAYRELRADAGEYIDDTDSDSEHDPARQRYVAMRPALDELDDTQEQAVDDLLAGFTDAREILRWGDVVEHATHGEIGQVDPPSWVARDDVDDDRDLISRCVSEPSTRAVLTGGSETRPARELFASIHVVPAMNRGVRDLSGRSGELPDAERQKKSPTML